MDKFGGTATGLAVAANLSANSKSKSFGDRLVAEGGESVAIGKRWLEADDMINTANGLNGWFASAENKAKAERLLSDANKIKAECEAAYKALKADNK